MMSMEVPRPSPSSYGLLLTLESRPQFEFQGPPVLSDSADNLLSSAIGESSFDVERHGYIGSD